MSSFGAPPWKKKLNKTWQSAKYVAKWNYGILQLTLVWQIEKQSLQTDSNICVLQ